MTDEQIISYIEKILNKYNITLPEYSIGVERNITKPDKPVRNIKLYVKSVSEFHKVYKLFDRYFIEVILL